MHMLKKPLKGNLADTPFPGLLFIIWREEKSGTLQIKKKECEKKLYFKNGNIAGELSSLDEKDFFKALVNKKIVSAPEIKKCQNYARQNKITTIRSLTELGVLSPSPLWKLMESFCKEKFFSLFDWGKAEYCFESEQILYASQILLKDTTPNLILQGIRKMKNHDLIEAHLPPQSEDLALLSPSYFPQLNFEPHEKYLLKIIENSTSLKTILDSSEIGKRESQKLIFAFLSLGIIGLPQQNKKGRNLNEFSHEEFDRILAAFNARCSYIFKYISKEIGPVALNVLGKSLDEIKAYLGSPFQDLQLKPSGKIDTKPLLRMKVNLSSNEGWKNLLQGLDEILAAEVLAVKKTLGNAHEKALVENLEKMEEPL
jgi:hypothetical protein